MRRGRLLHLGEQPVRRQRARHPLEAGLERVAVEDRGGPLAPGDVDAGRRERGGDAPRVLSRRAAPSQSRAPPRGRRPRAGRRSPSCGSISRRSASMRDELLGRQRLLGEADERRQQRVARLVQRVDGARRGRGRVVDLVGEPGRRACRARRAPRAGATSCPCGARSGRSPRSGGRRTGTTRVRSSPSADERTPEHPARRWRRGRWRGSWLARPTRGSRRPTDPGRSIVIITTASSRPGAADQVDAGRRAAPTRSRRGRPRWNSSCALVEARPPRRPRASSAELLVGERRRTGTARAGRRRPSDRRQVAVHEVDRHRALADRRRDPLHRVEPHVTGREHAGHARLERERRRRQRPARRAACRTRGRGR